MVLAEGSPPRSGCRFRIGRVEAYDQWPSEPERPYLVSILNPVTSPIGVPPVGAAVPRTSTQIRYSARRSVVVETPFSLTQVMASFREPAG